MPLTIDLAELEKLRVSLPVQSAASVPDLLALAEVAQHERKFEDAERLLQAAVLLDPEHGPTWALIGQVEDEVGDVDTARQAYRRAMTLGPDERSTLGLARLLSSVGEWSEAGALASYLARESDDRNLREEAAVLLAQIEARTAGSAS
jgi:Flp pilus assembly protein TadD